MQNHLLNSMSVGSQLENNYADKQKDRDHEI